MGHLCSVKSRLCFASRAVRVCAAFLLRVSVAVLLELRELAKPVERPRVCCSTAKRWWLQQKDMITKRQHTPHQRRLQHSPELKCRVFVVAKRWCTCR